MLVVNIISTYYGSNAHPLQDLYAAALQTFDVVDIFLASRDYSMWLPQNFVLTAQKGTGLPLKDYVRHEAIQPPDVNPGSVLRDKKAN